MAQPGVVEIAAVDTSSIQAALAVYGGLSDLAGLFGNIAAALESNIQHRFDRKVDPDGVPWPAWAPSTAKQRAKQGFVQPGNLMQLHNPGLRDTFRFSYDADSVTIRVGAAYAVFHEQLGGPGKGHLPRRAMLVGASGQLGQEDMTEIQSTVKDYFDLLVSQP
ncbi:phage virion morphogenesis protein [Burkholderia cepacia]|uniref:phage virion morphogenesis protein n=1 Tax=Burkholderia cepacia TaxID=292 RepID=UPI0007594A0A|nr:phage virion morphogenesis protein [Burkholderia cepacia]KWF99092.1 hypothetical protein WL95_00310 [Burkholderia cepacia]